MAYVVDPNNVNTPADNIGAYTSAPEIRSLKARVLTAFADIAQTLIDANTYTDQEVAKVTADLDTLRDDIQTLFQQDITLQSNIDTVELNLQNAINSEEAARIAGDNTLQSNLDADILLEQQTRAIADATLQNNINAEANARANAISSEAAARISGDSTTLTSANVYTDEQITLRSVYINTATNQFTAGNKRIQNLGEAADPYDAVSLAKVQQLIQVYSEADYIDFGFIFDTFSSEELDYGFITETPTEFIDYGYTFV